MPGAFRFAENAGASRNSLERGWGSIDAEARPGSVTAREPSHGPWRACATRPTESTETARMMSRIRLGRLLQLALIGGLWVALSVHVEGCTVIGFAIGASADAEKGSGGPALLLDVKPGRPVSLLLWNGRTLDGRFAGWSRDSGAAVAAADSLSPRGKIVRLSTDRGEVEIPAEDIAKVSISINGGKLAGLLVGLATDVMVIRSLRSSVNTHPDACAGLPADFGGGFKARTAPTGDAPRRGSP
jgi:hypothetical protein